MSEVENVIALLGGLFAGGLVLLSLSSTSSKGDNNKRKEEHKASHSGGEATQQQQHGKKSSLIPTEMELSWVSAEQKVSPGEYQPSWMSSSQSAVKEKKHEKHQEEEEAVKPSWMSQNSLLHSDQVDRSWTASSNNQMMMNGHAKDDDHHRQHQQQHAGGEEEEDEDDAVIPSWQSSSTKLQQHGGASKKHSRTHNSIEQEDVNLSWLASSSSSAGIQPVKKIKALYRSGTEYLENNSDEKSFSLLASSNNGGEHDFSSSWAKDASFLNKVEPSAIGTNTNAAVIATPIKKSTTHSDHSKAIAVPVVASSMFTSLNSDGHQALVSSANECISHIAFSHCDFVYVYPGAHAGSFFGEFLFQQPNGSGDKCVVKQVDTRVGAGDIVLGTLHGKNKVAVLSNASSYKLMTPSINKMCEQQLPVVFHVASCALNEHNHSLCGKVDFSDVLTTTPPSAALLISNTPQEIHDFGVIAHKFASVCSTPIVHTFDGSKQLNETATVRVHPPATLDLKSLAKELHSSSGEHRDFVVLEKLLHEARYAPFEYVGSSVATCVLVAIGPHAAQLEAFFHHHAGKMEKFGLVKVRVMQPFSEAHFLRTLPHSVRRVCVLDYKFETNHTGGLLFNKVASAAVTHNAGSKSRVVVSSAHFDPRLSHNVMHDKNVHAMLDNLSGGDSPKPEFVLSHPAASSSSAAANKHGAYSIALWSYDKNRYSTERAARCVVEALASKKLAACFSAREEFNDVGCALKTGLTQIQVGVVGDDFFLANSCNVGVCDLLSLLHNPNLDVTGPIMEGGSLLVTFDHMNATVEGLFAAASARAMRKNIKVFKLDSTLVSPYGEGWLAVLAGVELVAKNDFAHCVTHVKHGLRHAKANEADWHLLNKAIMTLDTFSGGVQLVSSSSSSSSSSSASSTSNGFFVFGNHNSLAVTTSSSSSSSTKAGGEVADAQLFGSFVPRLYGSSAGAYTSETMSRHHHAGSSTNGANQTDVRLVPAHEVAWTLMFPEAYQTHALLRPREHDTYQVSLTLRKRLTPMEYDRNIFHLEFDISGTDLHYEIGDALGVFGHNDLREVEHFIAKYNESGGNQIIPEEFLAFNNPEKKMNEVVSVKNLLVQHLDLFGRPSKKFYIWLAQFAKSRYEHLKLMHTGTDDSEQFKLGVAETITFADILLQHPSARPTIAEIASVIPAIKARHYSIASSMKFTPKSVHLLVVEVDWKTPTGKLRHGQCTRYLANLKPGESVTVDVMPSVLRLPPSPKQPIIMAGLGTGMAPFRAFIQERKIQKESGIDVGPIILYFGARHRHEEWLYGEEWDAYEREGLVTKLGLAFSRDQKEKVYIQHKILEDSTLLKKLFLVDKGFFYLCGPTWPVPDVRDAIAKGIDPERFAINNDASIVEQLKEEGRYILEVY